MLTRSAKRRTAEDENAADESHTIARGALIDDAAARPMKRPRIEPAAPVEEEAVEEDSELSDDEIDEERPRFAFRAADDTDDSGEYRSAEESFMSEDFEDSELLLAEEDQLGSALTDFDDLFMKSVCSGPRWPIDKQDESTSFSLLVNRRASEAVAPTAAVDMPLEEERQPADVGPLLDDFVDYESAAESLADSDGDCSAPGTPAPSAIEPVTRRDIPLYGYRHRNSSQQLPADIKKSRFMAALSTLPGPIASDNVKLRPSSIMNAYYQQALIAATGLNRRSLWSGKAKEMMGVGFIYN